MFQEVKESNENFSYEKTDFSKTGMNMSDNSFNMNQATTMCCPSMCEMPRERVCHRYFCYEVPHIVPCNTRIINHHVYKHTYVPEYTCCEENECSNVYENCPNNFF
ncbi:MAG: hypothetical protein J5634_02965 [Bacilli bacterium]|nr:hypothetical protein [Bacilli bacterium]